VKIMALDPGGDTGWVTFSDSDGNGNIRKSGELSGAHHQKLRLLLQAELINLSHYESGPVYVIYERFDHRNNDFTKLISCEYIGVIKEFCQTYGVYAIPQGSDVKKYIDNRKLEASKWYIEYRKGHARDAARHMIRWLMEGDHPYDDFRMEMLLKMKVLTET
jgi:hypothetical protein